MQQKVSVVIPVYQSEDTIERCVESIINGVYDNLQVILIEDFSKDNSWKKCQQLSLKYNEVIAIRNDCNQGVSYTRNQGLKIADGKYLIFVDSDDWVEENYIKELVDIQEEYHPILTCCGYFNHDEGNCRRNEIFTIEKEGLVPLKRILIDLYDRRLAQMLWNKIYDLDLIKQKGIYFDKTISIGEDFRFILDYLDNCNTDECIYVINKSLYHYMRDNPQSLMSAPEQAKLDELLKNVAHMQKICGIEEADILKNMEKERQKQYDIYGYIVCHNIKYSEKEKKRILEQVIGISWKSVYKRNRMIQRKEKLYEFFKR